MTPYNIASSTIPNFHISTAMIPTVIMEIGEVKTYETIVWAYNQITKVQGDMVEMISHHTEYQAKQGHIDIVRRYSTGWDFTQSLPKNDKEDYL